KEVIANAVHYKSHRSNKPFVKVNCSALPKDLIESHLFGDIKGSFTGANADKVGFIGQANGGSLLLDEIGEMPADLQPKLLRVLQEKVYYRVGSDKPQEADFRLISSTNRDPFESIKDGQLREDLYYRINTIEIKIPPMRERMEDVPMLAEHFLQIYAEKYHQDNARFSEHAYNQMLNYNWRGNVRELQHAIERAVLVSRKGVIESLDIPRTSDTPASMDQLAEAAAVRGAVASVGSFSGSNGSGLGVTTYRPDTIKQPTSIDEIGKLIVDSIPDPKDGTEQKDIFNELESGVVLAAVRRPKRNKQAAAELLGLYRPRLYGMIKRHNLEEKL